MRVLFWSSPYIQKRTTQKGKSLWSAKLFLFHAIYKWSQPPIEELASRIRKLGIFFAELSMYDIAVQLFDELVLIDKRIYGVVHSKVFFSFSFIIFLLLLLLGAVD